MAKQGKPRTNPKSKAKPKGAKKKKYVNPVKKKTEKTDDQLDGALAASAPIWSFVGLEPAYDYSANDWDRDF